MSTRPRPEAERSVHGPLQSFDLEVEISRLREEEEWRGRRNAITLQEGDRLEEHAAPGPISLTVREGRIRFTTADGTVEAGPETLLACDAVCLVSVATGGGG